MTTDPSLENSMKKNQKQKHIFRAMDTNIVLLDDLIMT